MNYYPHHHVACFCWVCRGDKKHGHPADRCHCGRCLDELKAVQVRLGEVPTESTPADNWGRADSAVKQLQQAGYYVSPVGEIEGDVYVEVEEEAVELWRELTC